jgi:FkbM family methyltransferase
VVKAVALDNVLSGLNLEKIDWIKIDVEGAELEVLKGLQDTLKRLDPR